MVKRRPPGTGKTKKDAPPRQTDEARELVKGDSATEIAESLALRRIQLEEARREVDAVPACALQSERDLLKKLLREWGRRQISPLRLYEPLPVPLAFHASTAPERLAVGSNRGGKTTPAAVEIAWAVTGTHPYWKYPKENGRVICVGKDGKHLGDVMWRKLSRAGIFRMILDEETGEWRNYRPWVEKHREHETKPMPPLIPERMIRNKSWEDKARGIPAKIELINGWELLFFSSLGKPPQGMEVDIVWFDEEIIDPEWYPEMSMRLPDRAGRLIWSATPQAGTERLWDLNQRAIDEAHLPKPSTAKFQILLRDNPYISEEQKEVAKKKLANDPDAYRVRIEGEFLISSLRMYPNFNMQVHGCPHFQIPADWCRFMVLDPGYANVAALFFAVPPPGTKTAPGSDLKIQDDQVYLYDEIYAHDCDARSFAEKLVHKLGGQTIQQFIIDNKGSTRTELGGKPIYQQYQEEFQARGIRCLGTGPGFVLSDCDLEAGCNKVRSWLWPRQDGTTKLKILQGAAPNTESQMARYQRKRERDGTILDKPDGRKHSHCPDCVRYIAMFDPKYIKPSKPKGQKSAAIKYLDAKRKRNKKSNSFVTLG